jgi:hypothetical protein
MILQLDHPLPMTTPKGPGYAHFVIDYGPEEHLHWVIFLDADGACWTVTNPEIRMQNNWTLGRRGVPSESNPGGFHAGPNQTVHKAPWETP